MNIKKKYKITILTATSFFVCLISMFIHNNSDLDAVYTSLFYIPILMTGLWYYRFTIPLATAFTIYCYILDFIDMGRLSINHIYHGFILIFGSLVVYYLSKKLSRTNQELETSRSILAIEKEHLRIALQSIGDGVISTDYNGNVTMLNEIAKNLTGWLGDAAVGRPFTEVFDIINEVTREKGENIVKNVLESGKTLELANHILLISKDGIERPIADSAAPIQDKNGNIHGVILVFRDVTERKHAEDALQMKHRQLTDIVEFLPDATLAIDKERRVIIWNKAIEKMTGIPAAEMIGKTDYVYNIPFYGEARPILMDLVFRDDRDDEKVATQYPIFTHEGDAIIAEVFCPALYNNKGAWAFVKASPLHDQSGNIIGAIESIRDITDHKRTETALRESENLYRTFIDASSDMIYLKDDQFRHLVANRCLADFFGKTKEIIIGKSDFELMSESVAEKCRQADMEALYVKSVHISEEIVGNKIYEANKFPVKLMNSKTGVGGIIRDITERKQAEIELKAAKDYLEKLFSYANAPIIVWNENFEITRINGAFETLIGRKASEILGKTLGILFPPHQANELMSLFGNTEKVKDFKITEIEIVHADGSVRTVLWNLATIYDQGGINSFSTIAQGQDITERKNTEKNLSYLSYHDHLTGLYNRRYFEEAFKRLDTKTNLPISIIICDINGLKLINDSFGHGFGDELLRKAAKTIKKACRADDVVSRLGGDEFVIILPKTDAEETLQIANHIREFASKVKVNKIELSISYGYDTKKTDEQSIIEIFASAENHMYRHKLYERSSMKSQTIDLIMKTLFEKSNRESLHSDRVSSICQAIASKMNLSKGNVDKMRIAGLVHDIGKIGIDDKILNKAGSLSSDERHEIERHPEIGWRILSTTNEFLELAQFVRDHHERWDGGGYPNGLKGEAISLEARIIAVADAYDAMTSDRSYRKGLDKEEAIKEMKKCSGTQFDPEIVDVFVNQVLPSNSNFGWGKTLLSAVDNEVKFGDNPS